jgi:hypothetical protein
MALETTQKYLDWYGLSLFWNKARQYISNEILALDATKIPMNLTQEPRTTISSEFEKLWNAIGGDATNISGSISQILGAYVKTFKGASGNYINIKVNGVEDITQPTTGAVDVELVIDETSLTQKLEEITNKNYVNTLTITGDEGITVTGDKTSGDVALTLDTSPLQQSIQGITASYVKSLDVSEANTNGNEYVSISKNASTGDVVVTINDSKVGGKFSEVGQSIANINAKDGEQDGQISSISQTLTGHTASDHVTKFGGQTGVITLDDDAANSTGGTVKFAMSGNKLTASVRGLGSAAYVDPAPYTTEQIEGIFVTQS